MPSYAELLIRETYDFQQGVPIEGHQVRCTDKRESMNNGARIMLFINEPLLEEGIQSLLELRSVLRVVAITDAVDRILETAKTHQPGILLLNLTPEIDLDLVSQLARAVPSCKIVIMASTLSPEMLYQLRSNGVFGVLKRTCSPDEFLEALSHVSMSAVPFGAENIEGESVALSKREGEMVALLAQGLKNKEIGQCLGISEGTVKVYLSRLFQKIGVSDRFELALYGLRNTTNLPGIWSRNEGNSSFSRTGPHGLPFLRSLWVHRPSADRKLAERRIHHSVRG